LHKIVNLQQLIVVQCQVSRFSAISCRKQVTFRWDDDNIHFVIDQHALSPHYHTLSQLRVFDLTQKYCMLIREAAYTNFIVFGFTSPRLEPMIYRNWGELANHFTSDDIWILHPTYNWLYINLCVYIWID